MCVICIHPAIHGYMYYGVEVLGGLSISATHSKLLLLVCPSRNARVLLSYQGYCVQDLMFLYRDAFKSDNGLNIIIVLQY